jgi:hypothetical protein
MTDDAPPSSDRRRAVRRVACFPGLVKHPPEDEKITALIADLAETGTRLYMRNPGLSIGDELQLELHVMLDGGEARTAAGKVVRVEPLPDERVSLWTHQVGVEFHERMPLSDAEIESLEKRQTPFGKRP